jgi:hypothetical protein
MKRVMNMLTHKNRGLAMTRLLLCLVMARTRPFAAAPYTQHTVAASAQVIRADLEGAFDFTSLPGRYLVRALSRDAFPTVRPMVRDFAAA